MKNHIKEKRLIWICDGESVENWISVLQAASEGLVNCHVEIDTCFGDYQPDDLYVVGWRPMTEPELEKAKRQRKKERERKARAAQGIIDAEIEELKRLKQKYPEV